MQIFKCFVNIYSFLLIYAHFEAHHAALLCTITDSDAFYRRSSHIFISKRQKRHFCGSGAAYQKMNKSAQNNEYIHKNSVINSHIPFDIRDTNIV